MTPHSSNRQLLRLVRQGGLERVDLDLKPDGDQMSLLWDSDNHVLGLWHSGDGEHGGRCLIKDERGTFRPVTLS